MKILFSKYFPIKGYIAINIFGILIVRKDYKRRFQNIDDPWVVNLINHEAIHTGQIKECGYESYYPLYILFWIIRLITPPYKSLTEISHSNKKLSYGNIILAILINVKDTLGLLECLRVL